MRICVLDLRFLKKRCRHYRTWGRLAVNHGRLCNSSFQPHFFWGQSNKKLGGNQNDILRNIYPASFYVPRWWQHKDTYHQYNSRAWPLVIVQFLKWTVRSLLLILRSEVIPAEVSFTAPQVWDGFFTLDFQVAKGAYILFWYGRAWLMWMSHQTRRRSSCTRRSDLSLYQKICGAQKITDNFWCISYSSLLSFFCHWLFLKYRFFHDSSCFFLFRKFTWYTLRN